MIKPKPLEFWFEFASTYSYLSVMRIDALARMAGVSVLYRLFLLGPIFQTQGWETSPFNIYPAKGDYMWKDIARQARAYDIPFHQPKIFPALRLRAARIATLGKDQDWCLPFIRAVFEANFVESLDIGDPVHLETLLAELGIDGATVLKEAKSDDVKKRLRAHRTCC